MTSKAEHAVPLTDLDRQLISELLGGKSGSWKLFVDRFSGLILQIIRHTAHAHSVRLSADDVDDLCADTFAELLSREMAALRSFRGRCSLATYLAVIVRRVVIRRLTDLRFRHAMGHVNAHQAAVDRAAPDSPSGLEARDEVRSLMSRLPKPLRQVARWVWMEEATYAQVAARLGRPLNSIGPMVSRIRQLLREPRQTPR